MILYIKFDTNDINLNLVAINKLINQ